MVYNIVAEATLRKTVRIDAESELDAEQKVRKLIRDGRIDLSFDGDTRSLNVCPVDEYFSGFANLNNSTSLGILCLDEDFSK